MHFAHYNSKNKEAMTMDVHVCCWKDDARNLLEPYITVLKNILLPVVEKDIVIHHGGGGIALPERRQNFNIRFFSVPEETQSHQAPGSIWGIPNPTAGCPRFEPSGRGAIIADDEDAQIPLAEILDNNLYILYDLGLKNENELKIFERLIQEVALELSSPIGEKPSEKRFVVKTATWNGQNRDDFVDIIKEEFVPKIKKNVVLGVPHGNRQGPKGDNRFFIWVWSSPTLMSAQKTAQTPVTMWGVPGACRDPSFPPTYEGYVIHTSEGFAAAELIGNSNLYIHFDAVHNGDTNEKRIFSKILEETLLSLSASPEEQKKQRDNFFKEQLAAARKKYQKFCVERETKELEEATKTLKANEGQVRLHQKALVDFIRSCRELGQKIEFLQKTGVEKEKKHLEEFDRICAIEKVERVTVSESIIDVFTDTLYCQDPRSKIVHEIGAFNIKIFVNGDENCIRWFNMTRRVNGYEGEMHAPHVFHTGKACMGNTAEAFPQLIAQYKFAACIVLAIQFIESVNTDDPAGRHIDKWPQAKEKLTTKKKPSRKREGTKEKAEVA